MPDRHPKNHGKPVLPNTNGEWAPGPELLTEAELIDFLRVPQVSKAKSYHNVIANLRRFHELPYVHLCGQPLYPREAILEWIRRRTTWSK